MKSLDKPPISNLIKKPFSARLSGARIQLVQADPTHAQMVWEFIQRDRKLGGEIYSWVKTIEDVKKYITSQPDNDFNEIDYLVVKEAKVIGTLHVHTISYVDHKAEIGYSIEKGEEGRGYASEGLRLVLDEMKRLEFNKAIISCNTENSRSVAVAERNGFSLEGLLVQDCLEKGRFRDSKIFGKLLR